MSEPVNRRAERHRVTRETDVRVALDLDSAGNAEIATGVPFFDHMLTAFAKHGRFALTIAATGDLAVDDHHTVEDVGLVMGDVWREAVGEALGIARFGHAYVPMDDALARVVVDCASRPYLAWEVQVPPARLGTFDPALAEEFWRAFATRSGLTLHIDLLRARNAHHGLEAIWKAAGLALREAVTIRYPGEMRSTKGVLG